MLIEYSVTKRSKPRQGRHIIATSVPLLPELSNRGRAVAFSMLWAFTAVFGETRTVISIIRSLLICIALVPFLNWTAAPQTSAESSGKKSLHAFLAAGKGSKRTTTFSADTPVIFVFWKGEGLVVGDLVGAIWIAEDVGKASAKDTEIRQGDLKVYKPEDEHGAFFLTRPVGKAWPVGKYRIELFINGSIAEIAKFTITPGVTIETH